MDDNRDKPHNLKELSDDQFEDTSFWSGMLDEPDDPSFVERPTHSDGFLDDEALPIHKENLRKETDEPQEAVPSETKKKVIPFALILLIVFVLLSITASFTVYYIYVKKPISEETIPVEEPTVIQEKAPPITTITKEIEYLTMPWDPFWLQVNQDGKERFLTLSFSILATTPKVLKELQHKEIVVRDAIYYYLQHVNITSNKETIEKIKKDIVEILNLNVSTGTIESIGIETFFIQ